MPTTTCANRQFTLRSDGCVVSNEEELEAFVGRLLLPRMVPMCANESKVYRTFESLLSYADSVPRPAFALDEYISYRAKELDVDFNHFTNTPKRRITCSLTLDDSITELPLPAATGFIQSVRSGVIVHDDKLNSLDLAAGIAKGFPNRVVYFVGSRKNQLHSLAKRLSKRNVSHLLMDGDLDSVPEGYFEHEERLKPLVVLSTFKAIDSHHFTHSDLVVFLSAPEVLHEHAVAMLTGQPDLRPNFFALQKASAKLSPRESTAVAAMFGPNRLSIGCDGNIGRPTNFAAVDYADHKSRRESPDADSEARFFAYAATIAKGVLGSRVTDRQFRPVARWLRENEVVEPRTAIVASSPMTVIEIAKWLPTWALATHVAQEGPMFERLAQADRERLVAGQRRLKRRNGDGLITTVAAMNDVASSFRPDVVLWVAPSPEPPKLPDAWAYQTPGIPKPLLLVDLKDRRVAEHEDLRRRDREYDRRDIFEVGVGAVEGRIRRFWEDQYRWRREASR